MVRPAGGGFDAQRPRFAPDHLGEASNAALGAQGSELKERIEREHRVHPRDIAGIGQHLPGDVTA
jgi:hypothetical protein